jgi:hypothetical protein
VFNEENSDHGKTEILGWVHWARQVPPALSPLKVFGASNDSSGVASFTQPLRIRRY